MRDRAQRCEELVERLVSEDDQIRQAAVEEARSLLAFDREAREREEAIDRQQGATGP